MQSHIVLVGSELNTILYVHIIVRKPITKYVSYHDGAYKQYNKPGFSSLRMDLFFTIINFTPSLTWHIKK